MSAVGGKAGFQMAQKSGLSASCRADYPNGLTLEEMGELLGHTPESNFEVYRNGCIIWKAGMTPEVIDEPVSHLDLLPTVSNLFGLEFDSRLYMGRDVFSDAEPLVMFRNRSWITEEAQYNSQTRKAEFYGAAGTDDAYVKAINSELAKYSPELATRPQIIIANKCDALDEEAVDVQAFEDFVDENEWEMIYVSAATGEGIQDMIFRVAERLKMLPPITVYESEVEEGEAFLSDLPGAGVKDTVIRQENRTFYVEGDWIYNLMGRINFDDYESLNYFQRVLQNSGVFEMLEAKGCKDGDTVSIYEFEFDYVK